MLPIAAGSLCHLVTLERSRAPSAPDDYGQETPVRFAKTRHWAKIEPLAPEERQFAAQSIGIASHKITIRHPGFPVSGTSRIHGAGRTWDVYPPSDPLGRGSTLEFFAKETA